MVTVLFFDITFLAEFICLATLICYCFVKSIVIFKKCAHKAKISKLMLLLFGISLLFGSFDYKDLTETLITILLTSLCLIICIIAYESKVYPDLITIQEDN